MMSLAATQNFKGMMIARFFVSHPLSERNVVRLIMQSMTSWEPPKVPSRRHSLFLLQFGGERRNILSGKFRNFLSF
jgi:hypothetical protein